MPPKAANEKKPSDPGQQSCSIAVGDGVVLKWNVAIKELPLHGLAQSTEGDQSSLLSEFPPTRLTTETFNGLALLGLRLPNQGVSVGVSTAGEGFHAGYGKLTLSCHPNEFEAVGTTFCVSESNPILKLFTGDMAHLSVQLALASSPDDAVFRRALHYGYRSIKLLTATPRVRLEG